MSTIVKIYTRGVGEPAIVAPPPKSISWNDSSDRRWLMNHLHHCMMNEKQVTLIPESN
jgi:hypothetical protein